MGRASTSAGPSLRWAVAATAAAVAAAVVPAGLARSLPWRPIDRSPVPALVNQSPVGQHNRPPEVDAGPLLTLAAGATVDLAGTVSDDAIGLPPGRLDVRWEPVSGPAAPALADAGDPATSATFPAVGQYVLALHAFDGLQSAVDHVVVNVTEPDDVGRFLRVMTLGDSITEGYLPGHDTYRAPLWHKLAGAGCVFDLVGHRSGTHHGPLSDPAVDPHHEGHAGLRVDELATDAGAWAASQQPNLVLVHAGTNDAAQGRPATLVRFDFERIVDALRAVDPHVRIFLAEIIPAEWDTTGAIDRINAVVRDVAAAESTEASPVVAVDLNTGFSVEDHSADGTHPNAAGERLMADRWWAALRPHLGPSCDRL